MKRKVTRKSILGLAERIATVRAYTAPELGADTFKRNTDSVILVGAEHRVTIAMALLMLANKGKKK